jgi:hypothetical protein
MAGTYSKDAAGLVQIIKAMADDADKANLKEAYTDSLRTVWIVCCAVSGVALVISLLTEHYDLDRDLETNQGLRGDDETIASEKDLEMRASRMMDPESRPSVW